MTDPNPELNEPILKTAKATFLYGLLAPLGILAATLICAVCMAFIEGME